MLKVIRVILAVICLLAVTFLFLDFTGIGVRYFGWLAKWQFIPALLSTAVVPLAVLILLPFVFGRVYCSVLCPLGAALCGAVAFCCGAYAWVVEACSFHRAL